MKEREEKEKKRASATIYPSKPNTRRLVWKRMT
jgi:hypothetical protein